MPGVSSSAINKTAIPEAKTLTAKSTTFGTALNTTPLKLASNVKTEKKVENTVTIDGVTMPRQPTQQNMAEYYNSEQTAKLLKDTPLTVYVPDNYKNKNNIVGEDAQGNLIATSHGANASRVSNLIFHGSAKINQLDVSDATGLGWDNEKIQLALKYVIQNEAKLQKKTEKTVDLSHVAVNLSMGAGASKTPWLEPLIAAITQKGGHVFLSAGNHQYSVQASLYKNVIIGDSADIEIRGKIPTSLTCSTTVHNLCETPELRKIDPDSASVKAPHRLVTRSGHNGDIEIKDSHSPTGWSFFMSKSQTKIIPKIDMKEFSGATATSIVTEKTVEKFIQFEIELDKKYPNASKDPAINKKVQTELRAEFYKRFGTKALISLKDFNTVCGFNSKNKIEDKYLITIPKGMSPEDVYLPYERAFLDKKNIGTLEAPREADYSVAFGEVPYFAIDKNKKITPIPHSKAFMSDGTSWATPYILAQTELGYRVQIEKNRSKTKL